MARIILNVLEEKERIRMKCSNCGHLNDGGRFCENCGTQLVETAGSAIQNQPQQSTPQVTNEVGNTGAIQAEEYLKKTKDQTKQYFTYFMNVLKKPHASLNAPFENQHYMYAIITFILYSLFIPLMIYFGVKGLMSTFSYFGESANLSFVDAVIIPAIAYGVFIVLVAGFTFFSIKLGRVNVAFKEVFTKFGILFIPFVFILAIGLLLSILKVSLFILFLVIGLIGSMYVVVPLLIAFYKKDAAGEGMDAVYGTLLTYILTSILMLIMGEMLIDTLISGLENSIFGGF